MTTLEEPGDPTALKSDSNKEREGADHTQQQQHQQRLSSSADEAGSLLHLYESRLRRLRENANANRSRVYSKYPTSSFSQTAAGSDPSSWQKSIRSSAPSPSPIAPLPSASTRLAYPSNRPLVPSIRQQLTQHEQQLKAKQLPVRACSDIVDRQRDAPPLVINVRNGCDDGESVAADSVLDDITISTGFVSNITEPQFPSSTAATPSQNSPPLKPIEATSKSHSSSSDIVEGSARSGGSGDIGRSGGSGEIGRSRRNGGPRGVDIESATKRNIDSSTRDRSSRSSSGVDGGDGSDHGIPALPSSSECSSSASSGEEEDEDRDDFEQKSDTGEKYTVHAAIDSKYESYSLMVDPDQGDRAVEIALYSAARPHMRAFHYAWIGFFVAFFNWFAITPLLSEVANSLSPPLTRKEVWTSNTLAVASSAITRVVAGPLNDIYGSRWVMSVSLLISAIPAIISGLVIRDKVGLYIIRFLVGVAGCTFVTCQFWTASMFTVEVAGTALSLVAGWGNLGGGVSQVVMGSILFPLFRLIYGGEGYSKTVAVYPGDNPDEAIEYDRASDLAWRTILAIPGIMCAYVAFVSFRYSDDTPKGNFGKRKRQGMITVSSPWYALRRGACNFNTWLMFFQYSCCFGVELTMTSAAALYFQEEFGQSTPSAAAIASIFGWMNLFARGLGGFASDMACATHGIRGRLWVQVACLAIEGALVCVFSVTGTLSGSIIVMAAFSIFVQAAEGSSFGIVPYIDHPVTGSISGIIGAGGNFGAVGFSMIFRQYTNRTAFFAMGCTVLASSLLCAFIKIPGHKSLFFGEDTQEIADRRAAQTEHLGNVPHVEITRRHDQDGEAVTRTRQSQLRSVAPTNTVDELTSSSPTVADGTQRADDEASTPSTESSSPP